MFFIFDTIISKSLTKYNVNLGYFYEAIFEESYTFVLMKYSASYNINVGYKHLLRRFMIETFDTCKTFIFT